MSRTASVAGSARTLGLVGTSTTELLHFKNILVATDFSPLSLAALQWTRRFAAQFNSSIHILHVIDKPPFVSDLENIPIAIPDRQLETNAKKNLTRLASKEIPPLIPCFPEVRWGSPAEEIINYARRRNVDLVLVGTHGRTGLKHLFLGSTAEAVVRRAHCPVLVVREPERSDL